MIKIDFTPFIEFFGTNVGTAVIFTIGICIGYFGRGLFTC